MSAKRSLARSRARAGAPAHTLANLRTWVEIDSRAVRANYRTFRKLVGPKVKLWAVVKSNAYGHGLFAFTKVMDELGIDGFCVDSVVEGIALRRAGIKKQILVLGPTLATRYAEAAAKHITITISNFEALRALARMGAKKPPEFHLKVDTGMHRQGFYVGDLPKVVAFLEHSTPAIKKSLKGIYTHFASVKDINYPFYTERQFKDFQKAAALFEAAGYKNLVKHAAATAGTLVDSKYHLDAVRIGIGLHGLWPSKELEMQLGDRVTLVPTLSWRAVVSEVKKLQKGDYVGYDLTVRVPRDMMMAILPIGYWHGFPRALSGAGELAIRGQISRVLGRVSMDLLAVTAPRGAKVGDIVTLIGRDHGIIISADDAAQKAGTTAYELLTRLNPLMERVIR
ncbi:MAG TPA: alanine racemase [Candidatus Paceibacterota bacterium]|jgi:alanine racemase|nr:alanine racemase [Candidatus Paceibacterota bacterium]